MSDDIIKLLRGAIAAGPTPGPWFHAYDFGQIGSVENEAGHVILQAQQTAPGREDVDRRNKTAAYIAAASPDNIAALLDRLDKAERENERLKRELAENDEFLQAAVRDTEYWRTENDRLREDAERWRFFEAHAQDRIAGMSLAAWIEFDAVMKHGSRSAAIDAARAAEPNERREG